MPRIQLYVRDKLKLQIDEIALEKASPEEGPNISATCIELLEMGVRVFAHQRNNPEGDIFNQMNYNKEMMEMLAKSHYSLQKILGISSYNNEISDMDKFNFNIMVKDVLDNTTSVLSRHFSSDEIDDVEE